MISSSVSSLLACPSSDAAKSRSAAARRPLAKACLFCSTATPFNSIARISASDVTGTSPCCHAAPSMITLANTVSPNSASDSRLASRLMRLSAPTTRSQAPQACRRLEAGIAVAHDVAGRHLSRVDDRPHARPVGAGRLGRGADHDVASDQRVGGALIDPHLMDIVGRVREPDEAQHRAEFLREAGEVEHRGAFALQMRRHGDQCADGDDAGAADAGHQQVERRLE